MGKGSSIGCCLYISFCKNVKNNISDEVTVIYPVSNISEFRTVATLTRFPDTETDTGHQTYPQS